MGTSATSQGNKRPVGYKGILTFLIYLSLIIEGSHGAACAGGVSPSSSYRDIQSFSQLHWLLYLFIHSFIHFCKPNWADF